MTDTAVFINVHKGASTFVADELGPAVAATREYSQVISVGSSILKGKSFADMPLPPTGTMATRIYPTDVAHLVEQPTPRSGPLSDKRLVLMWRDPRDTAISLYYSRAYSHSSAVRDPARLLQERKELQEMGVYQGVLERTARPALREFKALRALARQYPDALSMSYESLLTDPSGWLTAVSTHLGWSQATTESVRRATAHSFDLPQKHDPYKHKRRMTPGNWTEVFDAQLQNLFTRLADDELVDAGYKW